MDEQSRAEAEKMYQSVTGQIVAGKMTEGSDLLYRLICMFPEYAPAYFLRATMNYGFLPENAQDQQIDFTNNPDMIRAMDCATPKERGEYETIYRTCLGNIALQQECDRRKMEAANAYQTMSTDEFLFEQKENLENELNWFPKKIKMMKKKPVTYLGMVIYGLSHVVMLLTFLLIFLTINHVGGSGRGDLFYEVYSFFMVLGGMIAIPLAVVGMFFLFSYKPLPGVPYLITSSFICMVFWLVSMINNEERGIQIASLVFFLLVYYICFTALPLIFFIKTYPFTKRMGGNLRQLQERYGTLLQQYREVLEALQQNFANLLTQIQYECMLRRSSPTAVLYDTVPPYYGTFIAVNTANCKKYEKIFEKVQKKRHRKKKEKEEEREREDEELL